VRSPSRRELAHERLGARFESALSSYDTRRRVEVLVDDFLEAEVLAGARVLDVGCGLGFFSQRLTERGARVTACDLGPGLVEETRRRAGCAALVADALELVACFGPGSFDVVVSSECIEHTPEPARALQQMVGVLRPGGLLSVSTPNLLWQPVVRLASRLRLRPFDGLENFSTRGSITRTLNDSGARVVRVEGLHLYPFQLGLHALSRWCDRHLQALGPLMINICMLARKEQDATGPPSP
jgi:2-polyprenyl-6-hydroxyphenyl methylase/3-demethylubiquinone-9 3-methyltransferase